MQSEQQQDVTDLLVFLSPIQSHNILSKVNQRLKCLYRYNKCLSVKSRKTLCSALIQCHLDYASCCWYMYEGLTKNLKNKLQVAQNKVTVVRFILKLPGRHSLGPREFEEAGFLPMNMRVRLKTKSCKQYLQPKTFHKISV